ncbi:MAG: 3-dehydroquinate synthase [Balneolaceae bacterium]
MKADFSVQIPGKHYPVFVRNTNPGSELEELVNSFNPEKLFLIIDEQVEKLHGERLKQAAGNRLTDSRIYTVPPGESSKCYDQWKKITDFLLINEARRNSLVLTAGGGVTGDLGGFAVSTALRGLPLIHVPTTLLAMVDSSIGGKTGINHKIGKNLIGSFYQPKAVVMYTGLLSDLPRKEWVNGLSEILKYGAIRDKSIFDQCEKLFLNDELHWDSPNLVELIRKCAKIKADVVSADEKEGGLRMILNFGHTFAHALESLGGFQAASHGEAVFAGMIAATRMSGKQGSPLDGEPLEKFRNLYTINPAVFSYSPEDLVKAMYHDKKRSSEMLKLVLLQDWNQPYVTEVQETAPVVEAWHYALDLLRG